MIAKLTAWWTRGQLLGREIVAKRAGITAAIGIGLGLMVQLGVIPLDLSAQVEGKVTLILAALAAMSGIVWTRQGVTPANPALAPTSANGLPLIEADTPDTLAARLLGRQLDTGTPAKHDALE